MKKGFYLEFFFGEAFWLSVLSAMMFLLSHSPSLAMELSYHGGDKFGNGFLAYLSPNTRTAERIQFVPFFSPNRKQ